MIKENETRITSFDHLIVEQLARQNFYLEDPIINTNVGAAIVIGNLGQVIPSETLEDKISEHMQKRESISQERINGNTGFAESRWCEPVEDPDKLLALQIGAARAALSSACDALGVNLIDLSRVTLATTIPARISLGEYFRVYAGLPESTKVDLAVAACNSANLAFIRQIQAASDGLTNGPQAIIGIETVMAGRESMVPSPLDGYTGNGMFLREITNHPSLKMFSDGINAMVYHPNKIEILCHTPHGEEDVGGAIGCGSVSETKGKKLSQYERVLIENPKGVFATMPDPETSQSFFMTTMGTTKFFLTFLKDMNSKFRDMFYEKFRREFSPSNDVVIAGFHHPSVKIHAKARELLGLSENIAPWNPYNINAPSCTFGPEIARILKTLKRGQNVLNVFFGAGATGDVILWRAKK